MLKLAKMVHVFCSTLRGPGFFHGVALPSPELLSFFSMAQDKGGEMVGGRARGDDDLEVHLLLILHWVEFDPIATYCSRCLYSAQFLVRWEKEKMALGEQK